MQGHKSFKAIAVATDIKPGASPCGMCRQLYVSLSLSHWDTCADVSTTCSMREFTTPTFPIYMYDKDGEYKVATIGEVCLPYLVGMY